MKRQCSESNSKSNKKLKKEKSKILSENKLNEISSIFLKDRKNANVLIDLLHKFNKTSEVTIKYVTTVEHIFVEVLKRMDMSVRPEDIISDAECKYKEWLRSCYENTWDKLGLCVQNGNDDVKLQAINSLFILLMTESKFPLLKYKKNKKNKNGFPVYRLKIILQSLCLSSNMDENSLKRLSDLLMYKDVQTNMWLALESLLKDICKQQPIDKSIWNILLVLSSLPKSKKGEDIHLCNVTNCVPDERLIKAAVERVWKLLGPWQYSSRTQQLLLVVLLEQMMPLMTNAIFLTDYFMDVLHTEECEISMLALQGIFNLVIKHNIEYPNIFGKLYQLFTEDALEAKYKTRLFALADEFLRSTHLPLAMVAAFVKRFSKLLLVATPPDVLILLTLIANLLIRHPDLRVMSHNLNGKQMDEDPYLVAEKDPLSSKAQDSQLWEISLMQHHHTDRVARLANLIINDLPAVEYQMEPLFHLTWQKLIKKDVKLLTKKIPQVAEKFDEKPLSKKMEEARQKESKLLCSELNDFLATLQIIIN